MTSKITQIMSYLFTVDDDLQTCREQLEEFASHSHQFQVSFAQNINKDNTLEFEVRRKDTKVKAVSPKFYGTLFSTKGETQLSGQMEGGTAGAGFIKMWCYIASVLSSLALAGVIILTLRTRAAGYVEESTSAGLIPILFIFMGLFFVSVATEAQRKEPRELLTWLYGCFNVKPNEETIEKVGTLKDKIDAGELGRRVLKLSAAGLVAGIAFGFMANIEDNLAPLRAPITNFHTCTKSDDGRRFTQKETFRPDEMVYGCGDIQIEIVDRREIKIPLSLRWKYQVDENLQGFITHEVNSNGKFILPLKAPVGSSYQVGKYSLTLSRSGGRAIQDTTEFEIVDP